MHIKSLTLCTWALLVDESETWMSTAVGKGLDSLPGFEEIRLRRCPLMPSRPTAAER